LRLEFAHKFTLAFLFVAAVALVLPPLLEGWGVPTEAALALALLMAAGSGWLLANQITRNVRSLRACTDRISKGDLAEGVVLSGGRRFPDETVDLARSIQGMLQNLCELVAHIQRAADQVKGSSQQLSQSSQAAKSTGLDLSTSMDLVASGAGRQQVDVQNSAEHVHRIADAMQANADTAREASSFAEDANQRAKSGVAVSRTTVGELEQLFGKVEQAAQLALGLEEKIRSVHRIAELITSVAEKTHLLSLNASIEAARAGDAGRGFSAVAEEIRKLAESAGGQAEQIGGLVRQLESESARITGVMNTMADGVRSNREDLDTIQETLEQIQAAVQEVSHRSGVILERAEVHAGETQKMVGDIESIAEVATQNATATDRMRRLLANQTQDMDAVVTHATRLLAMSVQLGEVAGRFRTR